MSTVSDHNETAYHRDQPNRKRLSYYPAAESSRTEQEPLCFNDRVGHFVRLNVYVRLSWSYAQNGLGTVSD